VIAHLFRWGPYRVELALHLVRASIACPPRGDGAHGSRARAALPPVPVRGAHARGDHDAELIRASDGMSYRRAKPQISKRTHTHHTRIDTPRWPVSAVQRKGQLQANSAAPTPRAAAAKACRRRHREAAVLAGVSAALPHAAPAEAPRVQRQAVNFSLQRQLAALHRAAGLALPGVPPSLSTSSPQCSCKSQHFLSVHARTQMPMLALHAWGRARSMSTKIHARRALRLIPNAFAP
jgi:hypothetical protein